MQFLVTALDGTDGQALSRRMAVRECHMQKAKAMKAEGRLISACALLGEDGGMIGSVLIVEFESRAAIEEAWFKEEPYILGDVWRDITIQPCKVPDFLEPAWY